MVSLPGSSCSLIAVAIAKSIFVAVRSIVNHMLAHNKDKGDEY